jgi:transposase
MASNNSIIIKLLMKHIKSIPKLFSSFNFGHKQQKYTLNEYLIEILYVLKTGIAWRDIRSKINWNSIYKVYIKSNKYKIFQISYIDLLNKYLRRCPLCFAQKKLKYVSTDTSFIPNKKGKDVIGYNKFYNKKKGTKISLITDNQGIPFNIGFYKGNMYDSRIFLDHIEKPNLIKLDKNKLDKNKVDKNKVEIRYFMADPGYDSKEIRLKIKDMNYIPLIVQNKRRIKDPSKLIILNATEKEIYKKRMVIERTFNRLKMNRKICLRYVRNFISCNKIPY